MALHAHAPGSGTQFCIRGTVYGVIAMANDATRKPRRFKSSFVRTLFVHLRLKDMAVRTHILDRIHSRRNSPMVSMASRAGRRAQVTAQDHGFMVHAGAVPGELVRGDSITFHVSGVRVAARASLRHVEGIDLGQRVTRGPQSVDSMAVDAHGNLCVSL